MEVQTGTTNIAATGIPGALLLVFTFLIWLIFALILSSNPRNRLNIWCFAGGMLFSVGALKEFLFYTAGPLLIRRGLCTPTFSEAVYSVLSAVFYYLSMPTVVIFCLYFHRLDRARPYLFRRLQGIVYLPALVLAVIFPCTQVASLQQDHAFCITIGLYNWCYGLIGTAILVHTLWEDRLSASFRQRRLAAVSLLIPLWFWLILAFPYHALGIPNLSKLWQVNLVVVLFVLCFLLYHTFREGIWGMRFRWEVYDWSDGKQVLQKNAQYVGHALKNDLTKIEWCTDFLAEQGASAREIDILRRSTSHLKQFINRTQLYAADITLIVQACDVRALFTALTEEYNRTLDGKATVRIAGCDDAPLQCDPTHIEEVLHNLIDNAVDAVGKGGEITLTYRSIPHKRCAVIQAADNGCGMDAQTVKHIFQPYYTSKTGKRHMGLGLYYCWNVMNAHAGSIRVHSSPETGSVFSLLFPIPRIPKAKERPS